MTDQERLILKRKPRHHRHRLVAAVGLSALAIALVWGFQIKMTFGKYQAAQVDARLAKAAAALTAAQNSQTSDQAAPDWSNISNLLKEAIAKQQSAAVATQPASLPQAADADSSATAQAPAPAVAGAEDEVK